MLCYAGERLGVAFSVFNGVRVASGAQWPTSVAAQVIWQAKQIKFGFIKVYSRAPDLLFLTENWALRGGHLHDSMDFFPRAFVDSEIAEVVDCWLRSEWSSVQLRSAPDFLLLHFFFCDAAEPDCVVVVVLVIPWHDKVNKVSDWTLTDWAWGDHFRPHQTDAECGFRSGWSFWPVCGSYSRYVNNWMPSCPSHRHGKPGDFGSLLCFSPGEFGSLFVFFTKRLGLRVAFFLHFPRFLTIFGATFKKKIQILWRGWAVRRMIAKSASTRSSPVWGALRTVLTPRASSPLFFWRYTTPP